MRESDSPRGRNRSLTWRKGDVGARHRFETRLRYYEVCRSNTNSHDLVAVNKCASAHFKTTLQSGVTGA